MKITWIRMFVVFWVYMFAWWVIAQFMVANAHEFFTEQYNPVTGNACCNGKDCQIIGPDDWWQSGTKAFVKWIDGETYSIPANQVLPTDDPEGRPAACVYSDELRCLFVPLGY